MVVWYVFVGVGSCVDTLRAETKKFEWGALLVFNILALDGFKKIWFVVSPCSSK